MTKHPTLHLCGLLALSLLACGAPQGDGKTVAKTDAKAGKADAKAGKADAKATTKPDAKPDAKIGPDAKAEPDAKPDAGADDGAGAPDGDAAGPDVAKIAELARAISADPAAADDLLEKAGMDRAQFEAAMVAIAKDEWQTDLYLAALTAPKGTG